MTGYSEYFLEQAALATRQRPQRRMPLATFHTVAKEVNRQLRNTSPAGAALNPNFMDPNLDRALATVHKLEYKNQLELQRIRSSLPRATPPPRRFLPCSQKVSPPKRERSYELPLPKRRRMHLPQSTRLPPRWKSQPLHQNPALQQQEKTERSPRLDTSKLEQTLSQAAGWKPERKLERVCTSAFSKCAEYANVLCEYLNYPSHTGSFEDLVLLRRGDQKVNKHCRQDSLKMKHESILSKLDSSPN